MNSRGNLLPDKSFDTDLKFAVYGTMTEIILIVFDVIVHDQNLLIIFCLQGVCRLLTVAPHKIITNL